VMQTVAEQVAAELRGARLRDESETRAQRLALTLEVAKGIAGADSVDAALSAVVDTIFERTTYKAVSAIRIDNESQEEIIAAERTRSGTSTLGMSRLLAPYGTGLAAVSRAQVLFEDTAGDPRYVPWKTSAGWSVALATPVLSGDTCEATLVLYEAAGEQLTEADQVIMRTVAEQVAAALRGIRLRDQSEARARRLEALEVRQRGLLERLVRAQERERSRVAGDLHDDTVQVLSACVIALDRVRQSIEMGNLQQATSNLRGVSELVSGAVDRTRRMTFELRPAVLWHNGLAPAVEHLLGTLGRETGSTTRLTADTLPARLDPTIETIAFRSISELISNIRNHASARSVEIRLDVRDGELVVEVADDGRGFDLSPALERARSTNHLGLESMTERIDAAGGWVDVETAPGSGTRVRFRLPVRESGDDPADRSRWAQ
jgi:signal transduction histidine kinase